MRFKLLYHNTARHLGHDQHQWQLRIYHIDHDDVDYKNHLEKTNITQHVLEIMIKRVNTAPR